MRRAEVVTTTVEGSLDSTRWKSNLARSSRTRGAIPGVLAETRIVIDSTRGAPITVSPLGVIIALATSKSPIALARSPTE